MQSVEPAARAYPITMREHIVEVARRELASRGFPSMTIRQVAREVGVDPGTVRHYFPSKDLLARAATDNNTGMGEGYRHLVKSLGTDPSVGSSLLAAARTYLPYEETTQAAVASCLSGGEYEHTVFGTFERDVVTEATESGGTPDPAAAGFVMSILMGFHLLNRLLPELQPSLLDDRVDAVTARAIDDYLGERGDPSEG